MGRTSTPSFMLELPLKTDSAIRRELSARFNVGMRLLNNFLGEAEERRKTMMSSELWTYAKAIRPIKVKAKSGKKKGQMVPNPERTAAFKAARDFYDYSEYAMHSHASQVANASKWGAEKLDAQAVQKLASRAFNASNKVLFGKAKKIRFKVPSRFRSIEGKTNRQGMRWKDNRVVWCGLTIDAIYDLDNPYHRHGLNSPVKFVRIIRKTIKGKERWFVQLVLEGLPYANPKNYASNAEVGIDLNVSNVAFVTTEAAGLMPFAESVPTYEKEIKALQRQMDRSRRISNPDKYHPDSQARKGNRTVTKKGKVRKGSRRFAKTQNYIKLARQKRELERRKAEYAKSQNRRLANEIIRHGSTIKTENVSVKGWQKMWGKAIAAKSPGFFMSELSRKAVSAGGSLKKFKTQTTACSQTHLNGERRSKTLSQRVHRDLTGPVMHRDLMSAFLSLLVSDDLLPSAEIMQSQYRRVESHLSRAWETYQANKASSSLSESGAVRSS